jgi:FkbM family methyltransferase
MKRVLFKIFKVSGQFICRHHNNWISKLLIQFNDVFRNNIENVNFDSKTNGEERYLGKISGLNFKTIFDVGANTGEWSLLADNKLPKSKIYSFEILPKHWTDFLENTCTFSNIVLNRFGLSDFDGTLDVHYNDKGRTDSMATIYPQFIMESERNYYDSKKTCEVKKGSTYLMENNLHKVDLLKIDVEGHELKVIKGFGYFIKNIRLIQFEYGVYNITSKDLLSDFFDHLGKFNFQIGRLYPHYVDFFIYDYSKESFIGGNYIAVNKNDEEMITLLSRF